MSFQIGDKVKIVENWLDLDDFSIPERYIEAAANSVYLTIAAAQDSAYWAEVYQTFHLVEDKEGWAWPGWLLEPYLKPYKTHVTGEWPMADPVPEEDYYVHTQPGMYKTYQGPRIGEILGRR